MSKAIKLDEEEKLILDTFESGQFQSIKNLTEEKKTILSATKNNKIKNFLIKHKLVLIHISLVIIISLYFYFNMFGYMLKYVDSPYESKFYLIINYEIFHLIIFIMMNFIMLIIVTIKKFRKINLIYFSLIYLFTYIYWINILRLYY